MQLQPSVPNELGSALAGEATARAAKSVIAAVNTTFVINNGPSLRVNTRRHLVLLAMRWAEGGSADSDKKPGVMSQHLSKLRLAGLISARQDGRRHIYTVEDPHVLTLVQQIFAHIAPDGSLAPDPPPKH
jgi:DNA-binding transcriptional ArsR family regulator